MKGGEEMANRKEWKVKITDDVLKAAYANYMRVAHTREEFGKETVRKS